VFYLNFYRTARGDNKGTALSFVSVKEMPLLETVEKELSGTAGTSFVIYTYMYIKKIMAFKSHITPNIVKSKCVTTSQFDMCLKTSGAPC
jgi:superfamily II DNA/RNA helicase